MLHIDVMIFTCVGINVFFLLLIVYRTGQRLHTFAYMFLAVSIRNVYYASRIYLLYTDVVLCWRRKSHVPNVPYVSLCLDRSASAHLERAGILLRNQGG